MQRLSVFFKKIGITPILIFRANVINLISEELCSLMCQTHLSEKGCTTSTKQFAIRSKERTYMSSPFPA